MLAKYATFRPAELTYKEPRVWQTLQGRQRDEGGEEARVTPRVSGQDPNDVWEDRWKHSRVKFVHASRRR